MSVETGDLFPALGPRPAPSWLPEMLDRGRRQVFLSEKARSEFIMVPVLLACQELGLGRILAVFRRILNEAGSESGPELVPLSAGPLIDRPVSA